MSLKIGPKPASRKGSLLCNVPKEAPKPRSWFIDQDCHQLPLENTGNKIRWGHPDGYFLNEQGEIAKHTFAPSQINNRGGSSYPGMRECLPRPCHVLMAIAFYGERPTYVDLKTGLPYKGVCHHLIPDKFDYRPANLLCWLTREQHRVADARQRALKKVVPDGNLHLFPYERLRELQDPRVTSDEDFLRELESIRAQDYRIDSRSTDDLMLADMSHHMET